MCETLGYFCVSMCMGLHICLYVGIYQDFLFFFASAGRRAPGGNATVADTCRSAPVRRVSASDYEIVLHTCTGMDRTPHPHNRNAKQARAAAPR